MIISQLNGGLGNQLFVYATGMMVAKRNKVKFFIDSGYLYAFRFNKKWNRDPEILGMCLDHGVASKKDIRKFIFSTGISTVDMYLRRFGLFDRNTFRVSPGDVLDDRIGENAYLLGFLSGDIFGGIKKELGREFCLKDKKGIKGMLDDISRGESVSIHVRREHLLEIQDGYALPISYYKKAVQYLKGRRKRLKFYIFSDDIAWCEKNFKWLDNKVFAKGNSVVEDFELMKNCKYNILGNSTLSWWVGYLSGAKVVIVPKHFRFDKNDSLDEMALDEWVGF